MRCDAPHSIRSVNAHQEHRYDRHIRHLPRQTQPTANPDLVATLTAQDLQRARSSGGGAYAQKGPYVYHNMLPTGKPGAPPANVAPHAEFPSMQQQSQLQQQWQQAPQAPQMAWVLGPSGPMLLPMLQQPQMSPPPPYAQLPPGLGAPGPGGAAYTPHEVAAAWQAWQQQQVQVPHFQQYPGARSGAAGGGRDRSYDAVESGDEGAPYPDSPSQTGGQHRRGGGQGGVRSSGGSSEATGPHSGRVGPRRQQQPYRPPWGSGPGLADNEVQRRGSREALPSAARYDSGWASTDSLPAQGGEFVERGAPMPLPMSSQQQQRQPLTQQPQPTMQGQNTQPPIQGQDQQQPPIQGQTQQVQPMQGQTRLLQHQKQQASHSTTTVLPSGHAPAAHMAQASPPPSAVGPPSLETEPPASPPPRRALPPASDGGGSREGGGLPDSLMQLQALPGLPASPDGGSREGGGLPDSPMRGVVSPSSRQSRSAEEETPAASPHVSHDGQLGPPPAAALQQPSMQQQQHSSGAAGGGTHAGVPLSPPAAPSALPLAPSQGDATPTGHRSSDPGPALRHPSSTIEGAALAASPMGGSVSFKHLPLPSGAELPKGEIYSPEQRSFDGFAQGEKGLRES